MLDFTARSSFSGDLDAASLRFAPSCSHPRRGSIQGHLSTNVRIQISHFFIQIPPTLVHTNTHNSPINCKLDCPRSNRRRFLCRSTSGSDENPNPFESLEEFSALRSSNRGENKRDGNGAPVLTTFDFLELKRELEKEEDNGVGFMGETTSSSGKEGIVAGRRVMRRSNLLAKQVISMDSARSLGFVSQLWVDTRSWVVALVEVRQNFLSGDVEKFLLEDVYQVGDVVLVPDESVMENELKMTGLDTLVGYDLAKPGRRSVGKIRGYTFNFITGAVESLEFDSFGFSIIPSSLVSTYCLSVEDVVDVESDKVIVYDEAFSRVQRLTKGIWDSGNLGKSRDHLQASDAFRRKRDYADRRRRNQSLRSPKFPDGDDDWDLPKDYY